MIEVCLVLECVVGFVLIFSFQLFRKRMPRIFARDEGWQKSGHKKCLRVTVAAEYGKFAVEASLGT
jgi:hypothetical protein